MDSIINFLSSHLFGIFQWTYVILAFVIGILYKLGPTIFNFCLNLMKDRKANRYQIYCMIRPVNTVDGGIYVSKRRLEEFGCWLKITNIGKTPIYIKGASLNVMGLDVPAIVLPAQQLKVIHPTESTELPVSGRDYKKILDWCRNGMQNFRVIVETADKKKIKAEVDAMPIIKYNEIPILKDEV